MESIVKEAWQVAQDHLTTEAEKLLEGGNPRRALTIATWFQQGEVRDRAGVCTWGDDSLIVNKLVNDTGDAVLTIQRVPEAPSVGTMSILARPTSCGTKWNMSFQTQVMRRGQWGMSSVEGEERVTYEGGDHEELFYLLMERALERTPAAVDPKNIKVNARIEGVFP